VVTLNGGASWSSWFNQPTGQFYHVITDNRFPYWVYGAQQDSGAAGIPSRTDNIDGINLTQFAKPRPARSDNIAPDPDDPEVIFGGRVDKLDLRNGQTQKVDPPSPIPGCTAAPGPCRWCSAKRRTMPVFRQPAHLPQHRSRRALGRHQPGPQPRESGGPCQS